MVDHKLNQLSQQVDDIYKDCCGEKIFQKFIVRFEGQGRVLKSQCIKNDKLYPWYGYCSHCKLNPPHLFFVSFSG